MSIGLYQDSLLYEWELNGLQFIFLQLLMIFKVCFGDQIHIIKSVGKERFHQLTSFLPSAFKSLPKKYKLSYLDEEGDEITFEDQNDYDVLLAMGQRSVKIIIRENNEDFIQMTNEIRIDPAHQDIIEQEISEIRHPEKKPQLNESVQIDESIIEEKLKLLMPEIVSKIKAEITSELRQNSKIQDKNQPIIREEAAFKKQKKEESPKKQTVTHRGITCDGCNWRNIEGIRYKCSVCPDFDFCQRCEASVEHPHPFLKIKTLKQTPLKIFAIINEEDGHFQEANGRNFQRQHPCTEMAQEGLNFVRGLIGEANCQEFKNKYNAAKEEWKKKSDEWKKSWNTHQSCEEKPEVKKEQINKPKVEQKIEVKPEIKVEPKVEVKAEKKAEPKDQKLLSASYEVIKRNAAYVADTFGCSFEKCLKWAQMYPYLTKEELLNFCLESPNFLN